MDTSFPAPQRTQYPGDSQAPSPVKQEQIAKGTGPGKLPKFLEYPERSSEKRNTW